MFEFFFKYPRSVYERGHFALLGAWPTWVLVLLIVAAAVGLALAHPLALGASRSDHAQLASLGHLGPAVATGRAGAGACCGSLPSPSPS